jgi:TonB family protein
MPVPERFGRYQVEALIGEGSMGRVYRARDPLSKRAVAIKTVKREYVSQESGEEYLQRFGREARAAGRLAHPSIVTIYDVGENYFVMELLEGRTLHEILRERGRLSLAETLAILEPVAAALDYAHARGTVHRDVKPSNVMVLPDGTPRLMDFGVAHLASSVMTAQGEFLGSPSYMAPEQISRSEATPLTDLFSLAIVAYEALTGERPFTGDTITAIVWNVVNVEARTPSSLDVELPAWIDAVFERALAKEPELRFPSATSLVDALRTGRLDAALPQLPRREPSDSHLIETHDLRDAPGRPFQAHRTWIAAAAAAAGIIVAVYAQKWPAAHAPAPARVAPPATQGGLALATEPDGARVFLDGRLAGRTPLDLPGLDPGRHELRLAKPGYAPAELTLELPSGSSMPLFFELQPQTTQQPAPARKARRGELVEPGDGVAPPRPLQTEPAAYPAAARRMGVEGLVEVAFVVDEVGRPRSVELVRSASPPLDSAVVDAVRRWRFEPARKDGVPVRMRHSYRQQFVME